MIESAVAPPSLPDLASSACCCSGEWVRKKLIASCDCPSCRPRSEASAASVCPILLMSAPIAAIISSRLPFRLIAAPPMLLSMPTACRKDDEALPVLIDAMASASA